MGKRGPIVLLILDGFGWARPSKGNAIAMAKTPTLDGLFGNYPFTLLAAHGAHVGLPADQVGNSEAGHMNIGAGRLVVQDAVRISHSITNGTFFKNPALIEAVDHAQHHRSDVHMMGLVSAYQSAHADPDHLIALLTLMRLRRVRRVFLHLFTDGRDANPKHGLRFVQKLVRGLPSNAFIASVIGRHYAMERKRVWKYTEQAYDCLTRGVGQSAPDATSAVRAAYDRGETDEFVLPTVIEPYRKIGRIAHNDSIIFYNLRSDRTRQLTKAFVQPHFNRENPGSFRRKLVLKKIKFIAMTDFGPDLGPVLTAFPSEDIYNTLPIAMRDFRQLYVAEAEKYAHMTYFFNGGYDHPIADEEQVVIPSPDVAHYDATPDMSAPGIVAEVLAGLNKKKMEFIAANFANADMLGHTGNFLATVKAIEYLDGHIQKIARAVFDLHGTLVVTGDHGNAESMLHQNGEVNTEHSHGPVPLVFANGALKNIQRPLRRGRLGDLSPTLLAYFGIAKPAVMTGENLWR